MGEILQAAFLWSVKLQYVCSLICLEVGLWAQSCKPHAFSMFWNFWDFRRPGGQKTGTSMTTINTFKQGHEFLIKRLQKQAGGRRLLDQPIKGTSVMNQRKKKRTKEVGKGGPRRKSNERKGHEWQLIWGVSATPQRAMTSSGIEVREKEKGFFKKPAAYRGRNYICAKHAQVPLCCGGNHFQGWGLKGWINQLCLLWGLYSKNVSHHMLVLRKHHIPCVLSPVKRETSSSCQVWVKNHPENSNCLTVRIIKKCFTHS